MSRILVTGGLGFIGTYLVDCLLLDNSNEVTVIDSLVSESSSRQNMRHNVRYLIDDIRNLTNYKYTNEKFDTIFHLAALARIQPSFEDPLSYISVDSMGTAHVLEFARSIGASVVYAGSSSAYAGPMLNPYSFSKFQGEQICEMYAKIYDMNISVARFFNVYGWGQPKSGPYATVIGIFEKQRKDSVPLTITGDGEQRRDFTHVSDIARGLISLSKCECRGEVYNLGSGKNYSINQLAKMFEAREVVYIPARPGEARESLADITETTKKTGWLPQESLEKYIYNFVGHGLSLGLY